MPGRDDDTFNFIDDFLSGGINLPTPVQDMLGQMVSEQYRRAFTEEFPGTEDADLYREFWTGRRSQGSFELTSPQLVAESGTARRLMRQKAAEARQRVLGTPIEDALKRMEMSIPAKTWEQVPGEQRKRQVPFATPEYVDRLRSGLEEIQGAGTIGDVQNALLRSLSPGLTEHMALDIESGMDPGESFSRRTTGVMESFPFYRSQLTNKAGKQVQAHFNNFALSQAVYEGNIFDKQLQSGTAGYFAPQGGASIEGNPWIDEVAGGSPSDLYIGALTPAEQAQHARFQAAARLPSQVQLRPNELYTREEMTYLAGYASDEKLAAMRKANPVLSGFDEDKPLQRAARQYINQFANLPNWAGGHPAASPAGIEADWQRATADNQSFLDYDPEEVNFARGRNIGVESRQFSRQLIGRRDPAIASFFSGGYGSEKFDPDAARPFMTAGMEGEAADQERIALASSLRATYTQGLDDPYQVAIARQVGRGGHPSGYQRHLGAVPTNVSSAASKQLYAISSQAVRSLQQLSASKGAPPAPETPPWENAAPPPEAFASVDEAAFFGSEPTVAPPEEIAPTSRAQYGPRIPTMEEYGRSIAERLQALQSPDQGAKQLVSAPMPRRAMSYNDAFAGGHPNARGRAFKGGVSYVRNPVDSDYISISDLAQQAGGDKLAMAQGVYKTFEGAAYHESGHQVWNLMTKGVQKEFADLLGKTPEGQRLIKDWADAGVEDFNPTREEFAQAYATYASMGVGGLNEANRGYAGFFNKYNKAIDAASRQATVVDYRDPSNPQAFKLAPRPKAMGDLPDFNPPPPPNFEGGTPAGPPPGRGRRPPRNFSLFDPSAGGDPSQATPILRDLGRNVVPSARQAQAVAAGVNQGPQGYMYVNQANQPGAQQFQDFRSMAMSYVAGQTNDAMASGLQDYTWGQVNRTPSGPMITDRQTGELALGVERFGQAADWARSSMGSALSGNMPRDPKDLMATILKRFDSAIEKHYKAATDQAMGPAQQRSARMMRQVAKDLGKNMQFQLGQSLGGFAGGYQGLAYQEAMPVKNYDDFLAAMESDVGLSNKVEEMGGPQSVWRGGRTVLTGDAGGGGGYDIYGGGGGGGWGNGPRPRRGLWGGKIGSALYGAYIAKRLWSMTAAPVMADTQAYGQYAGSMAWAQNMTGGPGSLISSEAGWDTRRQMTQRFWQQGAFQEFGGVSDAMYSFTGGSGAVPRMAAAARVGAGMGAMGYLLPSVLSMSAGMAETAGVAGAAGTLGTAAGLASAAAPIALGLGGAVIAGTGIMELRNAMMPDAAPWSWGSLARGAANTWNENTAKTRWAAKNNGFVGRGGFKPGITYEDYKGEMTPQQRAMVEYQGPSEAMQEVSDISGAFQEITGEKAESVQPVVRSLYRGLGGLNYEQGAAFASAAAGAGYTTPEFGQMFATYAQQMGAMPGTGAYQQAFNAWTAPGAQYEQMSADAQQNARYAGMLSPYFSNQASASQLANRYGLRTQAPTQAIQGLLASVSQFGYSGDTVVGYNLRGGIPEEITMGTAMAQMSQRIGVRRSQMAAQLGSQLMDYGVGYQQAMGAVETYGITNPMQVQQVQQATQVAQTYWQGQNPMPMVEAAAGLQPFQSSLMTSMMPIAARAGYSLGDIAGLKDQLGALSPQQSWLAQRFLGGDYLGVLSYQANQTGDVSNMWRNQAGQPIYQTNFRAFMGLGAAQYQAGNPFAGSFAPFAGGMSGAQQAGMIDMLPSYANPQSLPGAGQAVNAQSVADWFGTGDQEAAQAWLSGGAMGRTALHRQRMFGYQMAGIGIGMRQNQMQMNYLWGAEQGGSWDNPAAGSLWALQDRMTNMQYQNQMANFGYSLERMDTSNQFAVRQEDISGRRMTATHDWQRWSTGFNWQQNLMQRDWTQEDWQYQDQMRSLNFGWAMEDVNDAIRTSSGRQRRKLVKQRERMVTKQNLEGEQIDTKRERQEELWAREDERFEKQRGYQEKLMQLDEEGFDLNKEQRETYYRMDRDHLEDQVKQYKAQFKLQKEITDLQREHQAESLALQQQSLGIQAAAAVETNKYQQEMEKVQTTYSNMERAAEQIYRYNPTAVMDKLADLGIDLSKVEPSQMLQLRGTIIAMNNVRTSPMEALKGFVNAINSLNTYKLRQLANLIGMVD